MDVDIYNPVCFVYFFPTTTQPYGTDDTRPFRSLYGAGGWGHFRYDYTADLESGMEMDNDIIYVSTQTLVNGVGSNVFTLRLVDRVDKDGLTWDKKIRSRDLILITMRRPGIDNVLMPVMFGVIKSVRKHVKVSSGQDGKNPKVERYVEVTGSDLTAILAEQYIFFNQNYLGAISTIKNNLGASTPGTIHYGYLFAELINSEDESRRLDTLIREPHEFIKDYLENYCAHDYQYTNIPYFGKPLSDFLKFNPNSSSFTLNGEMLKVYGMNYMTFTGSGGSFVNQVLQKPFNEIIIDYGNSPLPSNATCNLLVRPSPFIYKFSNEKVADTNSLTPLPPEAGNLIQNVNTHTITDIDVNEEDILVSDDGTYNLFLVDKASPGAWALDPALNTKPAFDINNIRRYGLRATVMSFDYLPSPAGDNEEALNDSTDKIVNYANGLSEVLRQWFIKQPEYYQGEITIKGKASIKVGERLIYISDERNETMEFYIHGVRHTFINFGNFLTTLSVSRGRVIGKVR